MLRFDAKFRFTLLYQGKILMQFFSENVNQNIDLDANIIKDGFGNGQTRSSVFMYNLSEQKRNTLDALITQSKTTGAMQFVIEYSYMYGQDNYQLLSYDDVTGSFSELGEPDWKTNLILKAGESSIVQTISAGSYPPGAKLSQILNAENQKLVNGTSIKSTIVSSNLQEYTFPFGWAYSGNAFSFLGKACYESGNTLYVDNGVLLANTATWVDDNNANQRDLNFYNGLLERPHLGQVNFTNKFQSNQSSVSYTFKVMLLPNIQINQVISVLGQLYTVKRLNHFIQTRNGIAYTIVEGYKNGSV